MTYMYYYTVQHELILKYSGTNDPLFKKNEK